MDNHFAGRLNGKQKAIGFIILLPMYFYVFPVIVNFGLYLYLKYIDMNMDMGMMGVLLNFFSALFSLIFALILFKDFIKDSWDCFKEKLFENTAWSLTIGIGTLYLLSIASNIIINLFINTSTHGAANQDLFETYLSHGIVLMVIQSVIFAPILEELLFRGLVFRSLRKYNKILAHLVSSFIFGFLHIYSGLFAGDITQIFYLLSYGAMGFAFSFAYEKKGTICVPILVHMLNNFIAVLISLATLKL